MGRKVEYKMRKHPKCYPVGISEKRSFDFQRIKACKLTSGDAEDKHLPVQTEQSPKLHWCYLCILKSQASSLSTGKLLGSAYREHIKLADLAISELENGANIEGSPDIQIFDLTQRLDYLLREWNLRVFQENRQEPVEMNRVKGRLGWRPNYQLQMNWYCEEWPQKIQSLIHDIQRLCVKRKGQKTANGTDKNFQLAVGRADKKWKREAREGKQITRIGPMSEGLSKTSMSWSYNGKQISAITVRKYLSRWEAAPLEAFSTGRPPKK